jgi:hypothetical protein
MMTQEAPARLYAGPEAVDYASAMDSNCRTSGTWSQLLGTGREGGRCVAEVGHDHAEPKSVFEKVGAARDPRLLWTHRPLIAETT